MNESRQSSHNKEKKTSSRLFGALSFRIFFLSIFFIITPLVVYLALIFNRSYNEKLREVYAELSMIQQDQVNSVDEIEANNLNFLALFDHIVFLIKRDKAFSDPALKGILQQYAKNGYLSAIFYLEVAPGQRLICKESTLEAYIGLDFTPRFARYFTNKPRDDICICKDPIFGYSLYINSPIFNEKKELVAMLTSSISVGLLIDQLYKISSRYDTDLSILNEKYQVLASNNLEFIEKQFTITSQEKKSDIALHRSSVFQQGYQFLFHGETHFTILARLPETDMYLMISLPAQVILTKMYSEIWQLVGYLLWILLIGGACACILIYKMAKPLKNLGLVMEKVGEGDLETTFEKDVMGFEINQLGEQFNRMVISLKHHIEEVQKERASNEVYAKELQIGHEIQRSILPSDEEMFPGLFLHKYFKPAKEVAGDFYDWLIQKNKIMITIADGVGKGVSSCLYAFDLRSILRTFSTTQKDLLTVVERTNQLFCRDTKETGNFVTAFVLEYNPNENLFSYVNCGHNPPIIKRKEGSLEKLEGKGIAFGVAPNAEYEVKTFTLQEGDFLVLYTDGVSEAHDANNELFGMERLLQTIRSSPAVTTDSLTKDIVETIDSFTKAAPQHDDITMIVIKLAHQ